MKCNKLSVRHTVWRYDFGDLSSFRDTFRAWRFVVTGSNIWSHGQSGQAIKLFQAPRKISFAFYFWHVILDYVKLCTVIQQPFWMKECDIFRESKHILTSYIFSGGQDPLDTWPQNLAYNADTAR